MSEMEFENLPIIKERTEDSDAWYARISSQPLESQFKEWGTKEMGIKFAFPKSYKFIRKLQRPEASRLLKHGWSHERTLFLDILYLMTFVSLRPAEAGAWIIDVPAKGVFYECVLFSRGYVSQAHAIELEDTILHETDHLNEYSKKMLHGELPHGLGASVAKAEQISREETSERLATANSLAKRYGSYNVSAELARAGQKLVINMFQKPVLMAVVAEHWLGKFCSNENANLRDFEHAMPASMLTSELIQSWEDVKRRSSMFYRHFVGRDLPET